MKKSLPIVAVIALSQLPLTAQNAPAADPEYRKLRDAQLTESFVVENLTIHRDAAQFTFKSGTISFAAPVLGRVTTAVFSGKGEFQFVPPVKGERDYMAGLYGLSRVNEEFSRAVFYFTDDSYKEMKGVTSAAVSPDAIDGLKDLRDRLRKRSNQANSLLQSLLTGEDMDNVEADLLADLYNPARAGAFNAYMRGSKYSDLRFLVRPRGAAPSLGTPEEVALINVNTQSQDEGYWYVAHRQEEYADGRAKATENKWSVDVDQYKITTELQKNGHLSSTAEVNFKTVTPGERVLKFGLLPNLRVSSVKLADAPIPFIQEARNQDGSFYVILPEALKQDSSYTLTVAYAGDKVIFNAGGGNFYIEARTSWYPVINSFTDQAKYDLTYRTPRQYTLVSVGTPQGEPKKDGDFLVTRWVSEVPLAVAGFNFATFKKKDAPIQQLNYGLESYANAELPDNLRPVQEALSLNPVRMADGVIQEGSIAMRVYSEWFGKPPYGRIALTQQSDLNFGQSWPGLVYLPLFAYFDSTQRYTLLGNINQSLNNFIEEVTPHEVAHQWWGHMVGWASYRDQWLSEGFADFSAGLFLQATNQKPDAYYKFLDRARDSLLAKNAFNFAPNDAGPLSMGIRLNASRAGNAYQNLVYPKGAYVLHMLRMMMWTQQTGDQAFKAMMQDYVKTNMYKAVSTEDFQAMVEKHMTQDMNLTGDGKMNWFFDEWVRGKDVPKYKFDYSVTPMADGKFQLKASLAQSNVSDSFVMPVAIYLELDGSRTARLGSVVVKGNTAANDISVVLPVNPKKVMINANYDVLAYE